MLKTVCHDWHVNHQGRMVDFAGWQMPIQYETIIKEHHAVRQQAGLFDIGHMGRLYFAGKDAAAFLDHIVTNDVQSMTPGQIRYALVTKEDGGILDDVLVYHCDDHYRLVVNASNRVKIIGWIEQHIEPFEVTCQDRTFDEFMLAIQGPAALDILNPLVNDDLSAMVYYTGIATECLGESSLISRTGYTGEDGFEVVIPSASGVKLWEALTEAGASHGLKPAGLGCRDTLRLEAAMPLYGHELDENTDPYTAGLGFGVKLQAGDFIGKEAVAKVKADGPEKKRVGLELDGRRIAREECELFQGENAVGHVTSGTFSPTLEKSIAMGYVSPDCAAVGSQIEVDIRGKRVSATVAKLPFYKRAKQ